MSRHPWTPELEVTEADVFRRLASQEPAWAPSTVRRIGAGWDNVAFLVDEAWVWRLPHCAIGARLLGHEVAWMPHIAPHLPVQTSAPVRVCPPTPSDAFPCAGYPIVPGVTGCAVDLPDAWRRAVLPTLADTLRALHQAPVPEGAPEDGIGKLDPSLLLERATVPLSRLQADYPREADTVRGLVQEAQGATPPGAHGWVHGDLYARHLVFDGPTLSGLIDWGDLHRGARAVDLSIAWLLYEREARSEFFERYGLASEDDVHWARLRAAFSAVAVLDYGREIGDAALVGAGRRGLALVTA